MVTKDTGNLPAAGSGRTLVSWIYGRYYADGLVTRLWLKFITSRLAVRLVFGINIREPATSFTGFNAYFDLTTILMRSVIGKKLRRNRELRLCEIGVGAFATLARSLSRLTSNEIVACDASADIADKARSAVARDGSRIRVVLSDVLSALPAGERFDLIFWNLPYYSDPATFLPRLFRQAPGHLTRGGAALLIGYNSVALPRQKIEALLADSGCGTRKVHSWRWNKHEILEITARHSG